MNSAYRIMEEDEIINEHIIASAYSAKALSETGVYFLIKDKRVVYVGQTCNLGARLGTHVKSKGFDSFFFIPVPKNELDQAEGFYIRKFLPALNEDRTPAQKGILKRITLTRNTGFSEEVARKLGERAAASDVGPRELATAFVVAGVAAALRVVWSGHRSRRGRGSAWQ